jgi:hypothetical protein
MPSKVHWDKQMTGMESKRRQQVYCVQIETSQIIEFTEGERDQKHVVGHANKGHGSRIAIVEQEVVSIIVK